MRFDWNDLRYFLAVARTGTVSEAARRLRVDHSTVSRRVDALEEALSTKLFERTPRGYGLTQPGQKLLQSAEKIDAEAEHLQNNVGPQGDVTGTVRISCPEGFGNFLLTDHLSLFAEKYPKVQIKLTTFQQIDYSIRRDSDIMIMVNPPEKMGLRKIKLADYNLFIYGSKKYLEENPAIESRKDLINYRFTGYIDDLTFTHGLIYLDEIHPGLRTALQSSSVHAQMAFARANFGLCVLPAFIARNCPELVPVIPREVAIARSYWLVESAPDEASVPVRLAAQFIQRTVSKYSDIFWLQI